MNQFERTRMLLGDEAMAKLRASRVAVTIAAHQQVGASATRSTRVPSEQIMS